MITTRVAQLADRDLVARMAYELWPDGPLAEHLEHVSAILGGTPPSTLPLAIFVAERAERAGELVGFIEIGLRSHADGCNTLQPVGFIEGWFVAAAHRRTGVGAALVAAAEDWSRAHGAIEIASDTWLDADESQAAHAALGFEVVDRCVNYRKPLL